MKLNISLLFLLSLTAETFSATIVSSHRYSELADGGVYYSEGSGPSFNVTAANMFWSYWGKVTVQSDPGIPILNVSLRFQSNPDQPNVDYHLYRVGPYFFNDTQNLRELWGTNLGPFTTELGEANTWEISWFARTEWYWWNWNDTNYQTIQGTATLVVETASGFVDLATYPITYTGGTFVPEASVLGFVAFPCFIFVFRRRRLVTSDRM